MSGDNHKHHASRHNGDTGGLYGQVENVARGQEPTICQDVKDDGNQNKGADHTDQAAVDLQRGEQAAARR